MIYKEETRDLFAVPEEYYLAHCISADFKMGKGIAVEFNKRFDMKKILENKYPNFIYLWNHHDWDYHCILEGRVFNLITKERYFQKPDYAGISGALLLMKALSVKNKISKIAMPIIGCGLDKLEWNKVSDIIKHVFSDTDIEILICKQ